MRLLEVESRRVVLEERHVVFEDAACVARAVGAAALDAANRMANDGVEREPVAKRLLDQVPAPKLRERKRPAPAHPSELEKGIARGVIAPETRDNHTEPLRHPANPLPR